MFFTRRFKMFLALFISMNLYVSLALQPFDENNVKNIKNTYQKHLISSEIQSVVFSLLGLKTLGTFTPDETICNNAKKIFEKELPNISGYYLISLTHKIFPSCKITIPTNAQEFLNSQISNSLTNMKLYQTHEALKNFNFNVDTNLVYKYMSEQAKTDPSVNNLAFYLRFTLEYPQIRNIKDIENYVKTLIKLGDEVDEKYIQFSGGVTITSFIIETLYKLGKEIEIKNYLVPDINTKLAVYLLEKRYQTNPKNAFYFYEALTAIANSPFSSPIIAVMNADSNMINNNHPSFKFAITNILGHSLSKDKEQILIANIYDTMKKDITPLKSIEKLKTFTSITGIGYGEKNVWYEINVKDLKLPRGTTYTLEVVVKPTSTPGEAVIKSKFEGIIGNKVDIYVSRELVVKDAVLSVTNELGSTNRYNLPNDYSMLKEMIKVLPKSKLSVTFNVKDGISQEDIIVQQVFCRFSLPNSDTDVYFIPEPKTGTKSYEFDLILDKRRAKEFDYRSGKYALELIVGDRYASNSISWKVGNIFFNFPDSNEVVVTEADIQSVKQSEARYMKKPEIFHTFKTPEKRPPKVVSMAFSILVIAPLLLMWILWTGIGFNLKRFQFSIWALIFHGTLAATFFLYLMFWIKLNMFQTMRYLAMLSPILFFSGNRLLRLLACDNKKNL